jgi:hypothetical protein
MLLTAILTFWHMVFKNMHTVVFPDSSPMTARISRHPCVPCRVLISNDDLIANSKSRLDFCHKFI